MLQENWPQSLWKYKVNCRNGCKAAGQKRCVTFQVQVLGPVDALTCGRSVYFQRVCVAVVSSDGHVVPLVVIQRPLTLALDEVGPISKVEHIVDVSANSRQSALTECFFTWINLTTCQQWQWPTYDVVIKRFTNLKYSTPTKILYIYTEIKVCLMQQSFLGRCPPCCCHYYCFALWDV